MSRARFGFRWYGPEDSIPIGHIGQIPCVSEIVSACYDVPSGELLPEENIALRAQAARSAGMTFSVCEGLPVHESIKLGLPERERFTDIYCQNIERLAAQGVEIICYNFMPLFGWLRTDLAYPLPDGSTTLAYDVEQLAALDPQSGEFALPGWHFSADISQRRGMLAAYREMGDEGLRENFVWFLRRIIPAAQRCGVRMAIHPDDPPLPVFGLPRIVSSAEDIRLMREAAPLDANGLTLCVGSLASGRGNDVIAIAKEFAPHIPFVHARNVRHTDGDSFIETAHPSACGEVDMTALLTALHRGGFDGVIRPDHGRMIFGESGKPGYGLYDRALGVSYLSGVWEALCARL